MYCKRVSPSTRSRVTNQISSWERVRHARAVRECIAYRLYPIRFESVVWFARNCVFLWWFTIDNDFGYIAYVSVRVERAFVEWLEDDSSGSVYLSVQLVTLMVTFCRQARREIAARPKKDPPSRKRKSRRPPFPTAALARPRSVTHGASMHERAHRARINSIAYHSRH